MAASAYLEKLSIEMAANGISQRNQLMKEISENIMA